jgi:hypothetical protein
MSAKEGGKMFSSILDFYNIADSNNADIVYIGALWHECIEDLSALLQRKMDSDKLSKRDSKTYFSIFVEMMSNMLKYSAGKTDTGASKGAFVSINENGVHYALSGNLIKTADKDVIKSNIDRLNSMDKSALRELYINKMKAKNAELESRGAGLGLIGIARYASNPIEYDFLPYDEHLTFFTMRVSVN